jgi:hypothetical protein
VTGRLPGGGPSGQRGIEVVCTNNLLLGPESGILVGLIVDW